MMKMTLMMMSTTTTITIAAAATATTNDDDDHHHYHIDLFTAQRAVSYVYAQVARAQSCANHVQHIGCLSRAAGRVARGTKD